MEPADLHELVDRLLGVGLRRSRRRSGVTCGSWSVPPTTGSRHVVSPVAAALARAVGDAPMSPEAITLLTLTGGVVQFVWNRVPVDFVALGAALFLYGAGVLSLPEALPGYPQGHPQAGRAKVRHWRSALRPSMGWRV